LNDESHTSRRSFISSLGRWLLGAIIFVSAWGIARFTLFEPRRTERREFARAVLKDLQAGIPLHVPEGGAWLIKSREDDSPVAFDDRCTHLGCRVNWDAGTRVLRCPCHGSEFHVDGSVRRGPAGRPLQRLFLGHTKGDMVRLLDDPPKPESRT
jgi:Rieske Fe-S protein